jgi:enterochelin esterase-like enzyme
MFRRYTFLSTISLLVLGVAQTLAQKAKDQIYDPAIPPPSDEYTLSADSMPHPDVPAGKTMEFMPTDSKIYPGTARKIQIYIPAAYDGSKPACLYVGLDSLGFRAAIVFDNLIAKHEIPVIIGIGLAPGKANAADGEKDQRPGRSFEFDTRSDRLARFILEEVIPAVERQKTPDGKPIKISRDPNDHAIGGSSTGGIGAFTVAWERPDAFRRVFTSIGTFVGMRGGEQYYVQVRKTEPKPIRIFQQDGANDEWPGGPEIGDWFMSNLTMNRALEFAGYDVKHVWGIGTHNGNQASAVFPDAMRWMWRDYPAPIVAQAPGNPRLKEIVQPGEGWQLAGLGCAAMVSLAADPSGQVWFRSAGMGKPVAVSASTAACMATDRQTGPGAFAFGPDGAQYVALPGGGIGVGGKVIAPELKVHDFAVAFDGTLIASTQADGGWGELWRVVSPDNAAQAHATKLDDHIKGASGLAWTADRRWLFVAQGLSHYGLSYQMAADGSLADREPFYDFANPETADDAGAGMVEMDRKGLAYAATRLGVQVFDRNGNVIAIMPLPGNEAATGLAFGGSAFDTLYVSAAGGKIYKRRLQVNGAPAFAKPTP